jgi:PAS domain S-box-containing protein
MRTPIRWRLQTQIHLGIAAVVVLSGLLIALPVRQSVSSALSRQMRQKGLAAAMTLAARGEEPLLANDFLRMKELINALTRSDADIVYAFLLDRGQQVLAHSFTGGFPVALRNANPLADGAGHSLRLFDAGGGELIYDIAIPVAIDAQRIGTARLGISKRSVLKAIRRLLWTIAGLTGICIAMASLAGAEFARRVTRRVRDLHRASLQVLRGDFDIRVTVPPRKHCWETMRCRKPECPAFGNRERRCWQVRGTLCPDCPPPEHENPLQDACRLCPCYRNACGDELQQLSESFDAMALALKEHIARLHQSREVLERSEQKYRRIFEGSMEMMFVIDDQGRFVDINRAGLDLLGYGALDEVNRAGGFAALMADTDRAAAMMEELRRRGFIRDRECTLFGRQAEELQVLLSMAGTPALEDRPATYEGIVKDVTRRRAMEQQLLQADKLASLGQLAAGIAHEINNPLGLILGYTQLLLRDTNADAQSHEDLRTIEKHTRNCKNIVEALLKFSRKTQTRMGTVDLNSALSSVLNVTRRQFQSHGVELETRLADELPLVRGDTEQLEQVFMNLIMNARQAIDSRGRITVSTSADADRRHVHVAVSDTGCGIPVSIQNQIFDPFFTTKPTGQGTGLGLAVSYGIVKDHGGEITVTSAPGQGSTFTVRLPARSPESETPSAEQSP